MEIQKIIEELKLKVDKLPKEANWFGNVDHIRQHIKELEQAFSQAHVSGRSEQLPQITDADYKQVQKILYPADNSKKFRR